MKTLREKIDGLQRFAFSPHQMDMIPTERGEYYSRLEVLRIVAEHEQALAGAVVIPVLPTNEDDDRLMDEMLSRVHEQRTGRVLLDLTPGGPVKVNAPTVDQAGGDSIVDRFVGCIPRLQVAAEAGKADAKAGRARVTGDRCLRASKQGDWNAVYDRAYDATLANVEQIASDADGGEAEVEGEPAWRKELGRLRNMRGACVDEDQWAKRERVWRGCNARLDALEQLDALRRVILSGNGEAVIPDGVRELLDAPPFKRPPADADRVGYRSDGYPLGWIGKDRWRIIQPEERDRILSAIDSYANSLMNP